MQYKPIKNCHVENVILGKDFNLGTTSSLFHVFTHENVFLKKSLDLDFKNGFWAANFSLVQCGFTLKMKQSDNVTKHVHLFQTNLHQLVVTSITMPGHKTIICFMKSMPPNYKHS